MTDYDQALKQAAQWAAELSDQPSQTTLENWQKWFERSAHNQQAWHKIQQVQARFQSMQSTPPAQEILLGTSSRSVSRRHFIRQLAIFGGVATGAGWFASHTKMGHWVTNLRADQHTAIGEQREIATKLGSLWLNTVSAVNLNNHPTSVYCELLSGELAVTANTPSNTALQVRCDDLRIISSRTRLAVRRVDSGHYLISVFDGEATVELHKQRQYLSSQQALTVSNYQLGAIKDTQPHAISWINGRLEAIDMPLGKVIAELNRYHSGHIHLSSSLKDIRVAGSFPLSSIPSSLALLQNTTPMSTSSPVPYITIIQPA